MNKLEVADLIEQIPQDLTPDEFLVALATKAAEVEREVCAKVCEEIAEDLREEGRPVVAGLRVAAKEIRARGQK